MAPDVHRFLSVGLALRLVVALLLAVSLLPLGSRDSTAQADDRIAVSRLHGPDRYATSLAVAARFVEESGGSIDTALVVSGQSWRDAAIAAGLAGALNAPLLLIPPDDLPLATTEFLVSAGVSKVIAIGAPDELSNAVLGRLARFVGVERIWRSDPIATSIAVAKRIGTPATVPGAGRTVVLASVDSLSSVHLLATFAAHGPHPVLLTAPAELDTRVKSYLRNSGVQYVVHAASYEFGVGTVGLSEAIGSELIRDLEASSTQYESPIGYLSESQRHRCKDSSVAGLATMLVPYDAFSAAPLMRKLCAPLYGTDITARESGLAFDSGVSHLSRYMKDGIDSLVLIGGEAAVPSRVLSFIGERAALQSLFSEAAVQRAEISALLGWRIEAGAYGVDGNNMLRGPSGFRIDLDRCPGNWSDDTGVTPDEIRIGLLLPKSGLLAYLESFEEAMQTYIDWVNEHDPVADRQIVLVSRDSADDPGPPAHFPAENLDPVIDSLIEEDEVFSVLTMTSRTTLGAYERLGDECLPHPFAVGGHAAIGDPVHHPWTTGMTMSAITEARLWGGMDRTEVQPGAAGDSRGAGGR